MERSSYGVAHGVGIDPDVGPPGQKRLDPGRSPSRERVEDDLGGPRQQADRLPRQLGYEPRWVRMESVRVLVALRRGEPPVERGEPTRDNSWREPDESTVDCEIDHGRGGEDVELVGCRVHDLGLYS